MKVTYSDVEWWAVRLVDSATEDARAEDIQEIDDALFERYKLALHEFVEVQRLLGNQSNWTYDILDDWPIKAQPRESHIRVGGFGFCVPKPTSFELIDENGRVLGSAPFTGSEVVFLPSALENGTVCAVQAVMPDGSRVNIWPDGPAH